MMNLEEAYWPPNNFTKTFSALRIRTPSRRSKGLLSTPWTRS
jgi:hypothetical protein